MAENMDCACGLWLLPSGLCPWTGYLFPLISPLCGMGLLLTLQGSWKDLMSIATVGTKSRRDTSSPCRSEVTLGALCPPSFSGQTLRPRKAGGCVFLSVGNTQESSLTDPFSLSNTLPSLTVGDSDLSCAHVTPWHWCLCVRCRVDQKSHPHMSHLYSH